MDNSKGEMKPGEAYIEFSFVTAGKRSMHFSGRLNAVEAAPLFRNLERIMEVEGASAEKGEG